MKSESMVLGSLYVAGVFMHMNESVHEEKANDENLH